MCKRAEPDYAVPRDRGAAALGQKRLAIALLLALTALVLARPPAIGASTLPAGYRDSVVFAGLTEPTAVRFSPDGRVFVAEKSGRILVYSSLDDATPAVFADLSTNVYSFWDRGLLGLALDPDFPATPYVYVAYAFDALPGGSAPKWGTPGVLSDPCPTPPGPTADGCVVSGRLSRLAAAGDRMAGAEQVLIEDWCQQFPSHSLGDLEFGPEGALYLGAGEGADFFGVDYGQRAGNPCADPAREGGALRSQDLRTRSDVVGLDGTIVRVDPATGAPWPTNAFDGDPNARRILASGLRNPFRFAFRPGTSDLWIGDVGWNSSEEINVLVGSAGQPVGNFGWPCYEGNQRQGAYEALDLDLCERLYASAGAVTVPRFAYSHGGPVVPGDGCRAGGSSLSGLAFYEGAAYPGYTGALFFADYSRNCIWTMLPDEDGEPDPATRRLFVLDASGPVDLQTGPNGDLFYVDFGSGSPGSGAVRRIVYRPPTALVTADPTTGAAPLTVQFDGSGSTDSDGGDALTYAWDFDGDGQADATSPQAGHTFASRGSYAVRLEVTDLHGLTDTASLVVNVDNGPPLAAIAAPVIGTTWRVGDVIAFSGGAIDPEAGALPPAALSWQLLLHHCPASCHVHPIQTITGVAGGTFTASDHEYPSHLELRLTATDTDGLSATDGIRLNPTTTLLRLLSSPSGLALVIGSEAVSTPSEREVIVGSRNTITAPSPQALGGTQLLFSVWSDGGARTHEIVAPAGPATYTATFAAPASAPLPTPPPPLQPPPPPASPKVKGVVCVVPKLVGRMLAAARRSLLRARCGLGRVYWIYSRAPNGRVLSQNPRAGRRLTPRAKVAVVASRGRRR